MLGFFVTAVVNRWTYLYQIIGFIDNIGLMTAEYVRGRTEQARLYRRSIVRYCELAQVLVFRDISMRTRRRFPTLDTVVAAGFMMPHEKDRFEEIQYRYSKYWVPFQWALALTYDARKKGIIESDYYQVVVTNEIKQFRTGLAWICNYDWVPIPIMYPQLVCLAVHTYFLVCLLARQYIVHEGATNQTEIDLYVPIMSILQFIFYMGWMKVAESMLNPFGEDDTNALIDRNIAMVLMMADQGYDRPPDLKRDPFWDDAEIEPLYSEESARHPINLLKGSVSDIKLPEHVHEIKMVPHISDNSPSRQTSLRRRVSVVPVKESFSKPHLDLDPSRTFSHGQLESLGGVLHSKEDKENHSPGKITKSFSNNGFIESDDTRSTLDEDEKEKLPPFSKSWSGVSLPRRLDEFPHHVLENVMEENEEEQQFMRKKSIFDPAGTIVLPKESMEEIEKQQKERSVDGSTKKAESDKESEKHKGKGKDEDSTSQKSKKDESDKPDDKRKNKDGNRKDRDSDDDQSNTREGQRSSEFFIGSDIP
ncbi:hypothetical protein WR25_03945 [Diploscapter pachys]|uniref:Bestrophin homolog n=1 Tax=Diploscapter pachys TaxID=2018661 RepID=A0A2A2KS72_9BILA|nr:hypothetical protein WR25_03945 [Diploscapter pachys]